MRRTEYNYRLSLARLAVMLALLLCSSCISMNKEYTSESVSRDKKTGDTTIRAVELHLHQHKGCPEGQVKYAWCTQKKTTAPAQAAIFYKKSTSYCQSGCLKAGDEITFSAAE